MSAAHLRLTVLTMLVTLTTGCVPDVSPAATSPLLSNPLIVEIIAAATSSPIAMALGRNAATLPDFLDGVPGVDGQGPFSVEVLPDIPYRDTPQRTLTMNIHRPIPTDEVLRRAVVVFNGTAFVGESDFGAAEVWCDFLASRGVIAMNARYRLKTEPDVTVDDVLTDAVAAVRFAIAQGPQYGIDPDRVGVLGRSTGGQVALLVGMIPDPEQFGPAGNPDIPLAVNAIVDIAGSTDVARLYESPEPTLIPRFVVRATYGGAPSDVPDVYAKVSPLTYLRAGLPPVLIVHGELDLVVPISQSRRLADALEAAGNVVERAFNPHSGHTIGWGLFNNDGCGRALEAIVPFLERNL